MKCYSVFLHKMYTEGDPLVFNVQLFGMYRSFCWMYCKQCLLTFNKFLRIFHWFHCFKLYSKERKKERKRERKKETWVHHTCAVWHICEWMFFLLVCFTGSGCGPDAFSCVLIYLHSVHVVVFLGTCNSDTYKKTFANAFTLFHNDINLYKNIFVINTAV